MDSEKKREARKKASRGGKGTFPKDELDQRAPGQARSSKLARRNEKKDETPRIAKGGSLNSGGPGPETDKKKTRGLRWGNTS